MIPGIGGLGVTELLLIFGALLLMFGAKRLPDLGKSLGSTIREFKWSLGEVRKIVEERDDIEEPKRLQDGEEG